MNIIFGENVKQLPDSFTVLELDSIKDRETGNIYKTWCVLESIPLVEFPTLENYKKIHNDLLEAYRSKNWEYCKSAIKGLTGRWNGELDTFYEHLNGRVEFYENNTPEENWDGCIEK